MLSTSYEFRKKIGQNSKTLFKATLTLANGTVVNITGDDVIMGTAKYDSATSRDGNFDIGGAVMGSFRVTLNNYDDRFSEYDFTNAIIAPYEGVELDAGGVEWLAKGVYGVDQPESYGSTISLTALDNLRLLEKPYSNVVTAYPASLQTIAVAICSACGVTLLNDEFANYTYSVGARPDDASLSCLDMISYVAQISGNHVHCDPIGRLVFGWYDESAFDVEDWLDGGVFDDETPYESGDTADGGNFDNYTSGDTADGGDLDISPVAIIHAISSSTICTDDVVITGVRVTAQDEVETDGTMGDYGETYLYGAEGYVLLIENNPLVLYGEASAVATMVGLRVVGMTFRPFHLSAIGDPAIEAGDPVIVIDGKSNQYRSFITSLTYTSGGFESFACDAETPGRNTAAAYGALTKAYVNLKNKVTREQTARETAVATLAYQIANSSGLYMTAEEQVDHSFIYYMHDKPTLAESQIVWKMTANAFAVSTDGGTTYAYGLDANGDAVLNRIYAIGINADYITTGSLDADLITSGKIQSANGKVFFDLDNNELHCNQLVSMSTMSTFTVADVAAVWSAGSNYYYGLRIYKDSYSEGALRLLPEQGDSWQYCARISVPKRMLIYAGDAPGSNSHSTVNSASIRLGSTNLIIRSGYEDESYQANEAVTVKTKYIQLSAGTSTTVNHDLSVINGTKSRLVETENYSRRLLYCYETPVPFFGDIGSGVIGDDGFCYVEIDDIFGETARTDFAYKVFLQKCGQGDLWVSKKVQTYFVVQGTPGLAFDWELKARQVDFADLRLENESIKTKLDHEQGFGYRVESAYGDEYGFIQQLEGFAYEAA